MNLRNLEIKLKDWRNTEKSDCAYPVKTQTFNIHEFLTNFASPIKANKKIVYLDSEDKYPKYYNITETKDILNDRLDVVGMAYDSMVDRFITWFLQPHRVDSYEKSLKQGSHIGVIGIIDLKSNIDSLEELKTLNEFLEYEEELQSEIDYWKSYFYEKDGKTVKFRYYVIVGKNRSLFAIPKIYEKYFEKGTLEKVSSLFQIDVKIWTKFVSREFKTELYRNEKNNMKDTKLQELIGWGGPLVEFISTYPQKELVKTVISHLFNDDQLLMIMDREMLVDCYGIHAGEYGSSNINNWTELQFEKGIKVNKEFESNLDYFFNVLNAWIEFRENGEYKKYPIAKGSAWRLLLFALVREIKQNDLKINIPNKKELFKKVIEIALQVRADLEEKDETYAFLGKGTPLTVKNLMGGLKSTTCYYSKSFDSFSKNFKFNEDKAKKSNDIVAGYQYDVMTRVFFDRFWKRMEEENLLVLPAKRDFKPSEVSYIINRDGSKVRINGSIYNSKNKVIRYSDENPNDPFIKEYGTDIDYIVLPYSIIMGDAVQIDHIPPYSKNIEVKDLDKCEAASSGYNNWKSDREAVYESEILEQIQYNKQLDE